MASTLAYEIDRALESLRDAMTDPDPDSEGVSGTASAPVEFTWKGAIYPCTPSKVVRGKLFGAGGLTPEANIILSVQESILPVPGPSPDQFITYAGSKYRIDTVTTQQGSVLLACNDPNRGAGIVEREM